MPRAALCINEFSYHLRNVQKLSLAEGWHGFHSRSDYETDLAPDTEGRPWLTVGGRAPYILYDQSLMPEGTVVHSVHLHGDHVYFFFGIGVRE